MSRVAKNHIDIPEGTKYTFENNLFVVTGKEGELTVKIDKKYTIKDENNKLYVLPINDKDKENPIWGTTRAHIYNSILGVNKKFIKTLELNGTGYRASISGTRLKLQLGFSHDIDYEIPQGVKVECPKPNIINISSSNIDLLGKVASKIRSFRKPEPFKGKGIKYKNEYIFRKEGKKK
ncbi:MAG: 50S ribosomal protein L6 [Alphaproteobacteria bacterium MarineAlpha5_Bin9]|mgnify:CR=1 FL=1|nr:MAG: 50S ribosomal protein L6 [Alphaproteobacteria bacterium MarineAlpha5_Bin9]|tara:strand:+ start:5302 stop:5835 length:534 start_codon:yes stop_codon:yes gene_type:complete